MKFEAIRIGRFGGIRDLATGPDPLPDLVTVAGPNEAGKSTFFRCLTSLLYGFSPATRELNRDAPWDGHEAAGWARIRSDDGDVLEVRRRLRSSPWGKLLRHDQEEDLRNGPIPLVDRLPRGVYRQVFALTLSEVAALQASDWSEVQDRLVSAMGAQDLVPPRDVAEKMEEEAGALWRPNRRGNQQVRDLGVEIRRIEALRQEALERDTDIRARVEAIRSGASELESLEAERSRIHALEERVGRLLPVHRQLRRIDELQELAGNPTELEGIPPDPEHSLASLREKAAALSVRIHDAEALAEALRENERRARSIVAELFGPAFTGPVPLAVRGLATAALRDRVRGYGKARDERRLAEASAEATRPEPGRQRDRRAPAVLLGSGAVLLVIGLMTGQPIVTALGMAVSVLGGWLLRPNRSVLAPQPVDPEPRLAALRSAESEARRRLSELLSELPLTDEVLENPTLELPALLQRLQELDRDMRAQISKATEIAPATPPTPLPPDQEDQLSLLAGLGVPGPEPGTEPDPEIRADATAPGPHSSDADAREVARRLDGAREKLRTSLGGVEAERGALEARLGLLGDGDVEVGIATAVERYNARRTSQELARDLAQSQPALPDLRLEIQAAVSAGEEWTEDPHALTSLQRRRQELTARIESRGRDLVRSRQALERLEELPTADQVDGQVLALRRQRADLARERDRLTLIARLLRDADRRFREERQPRVLARAGEYLDHVTDGRYSQIVTAREDDREVFKLLGHAHRDPVSMETGVSTGTREQGYLALRLAAVEELDAGGERLPIFVDEVFVNWDADRRARGMELLSRISASRQVFVFTCHRQVATALEDLGGHTLMMADGRLRSLEEAR